MTRYELLDRIGVGGMAEIFRGRAVAEGGFEKIVAVKRVLPHLSEDQRFVNMLIAEANTLAQLRHRNIVQIFDVGLGDDGQYFLVMEFVDGTDLRTLFAALEERGKRLPAHLSTYIATEVCESLHFAHCATAADGTLLHLVHRDVSPPNVLLSASGEVKLTDFGIAKTVEEVTGRYGLQGKFAYMSPEQARGGSVDARSDVFSLGLLLFEFVTGHRLFSGLDDFAALSAVRDSSLPRARDYDPSLSPVLDSIIGRALERDPASRFETAADFGAALRDFRYSTSSAVGDPANELSRIMEIAHRRKPDSESITREPTVLKIHTAAAFSTESLLTDVGFDEEETRALDDDDDGETTAARFTPEPTREVSIEQLLEMAPAYRPEMPSATEREPVADSEREVTEDTHDVPPVLAPSAAVAVREVADHESERAHADSQRFGRGAVPSDGGHGARTIVAAAALGAALALGLVALAGSLLGEEPVRRVPVGAADPSAKLYDSELDAAPPPSGSPAVRKPTPRPASRKASRKKRSSAKGKKRKSRSRRKSR